MVIKSGCVIVWKVIMTVEAANLKKALMWPGLHVIANTTH